MNNIKRLYKLVLDIVFSRFGKVFIAGGCGGVSQLISYGLVFDRLLVSENIFHLPEFISIFNTKIYPGFFIAQMLAIEVGIFVSFYINNNFAFSDNKLKGMLYIKRFLKNHLVTALGISIQLVTGLILAAIFGINDISKYVYQIIGILLGLISNFYFYKKVIWKIS